MSALRPTQLYKLLLILMLSFCGHAAESEQPEIVPATKAGPNLLEEFIAIIEKNYYDTTFSGIDWKSLTQKARAAYAAEPNNATAHAQIEALVQAFPVSHFNFHSHYSGADRKANVTLPSGISPRQLDLTIEWVENQWAVVSVREDSEAWAKGLRPGFVVTHINDVPTAELFSDDSPKVRSLRMIGALQSLPKQVVLKGTDAQGKEAILDFNLAPFHGDFEAFGNISSPTHVNSRFYEKEQIGYVSFDIFLPKCVEKVQKIIDGFRAKGAKGIIIDIRNNPGGLGILSCAIARKISSESFILGEQKSRDGNEIYKVFGQADAYTGPVALLTNSSSASTSEVLAGGLRASRSAVVIGETTAGMVLPSVAMTLSDGSMLQFPVADFKIPDGTLLEGRGAIPDIAVSHRLAALREGRDLYVEAAIKHLVANPARPAIVGAIKDEATTLRWEGRQVISADAQAILTKVDEVAGTAKMADLDSFLLQATASIRGMGISIKVRSISTQDKTRVDTKLPNMNSTMIFDGKKAWKKDMISGTTELPTTNTEDMLINTLRMMKKPYAFYDEITVAEASCVFEGRQCVKLRLFRQGRDPEFMYINKENFLIAGGEKVEVSESGGKEPIITIFNAYARHEKGFLYPSSFIQKAGPNIIDNKVTGLKVNEPVDPAIFTH